MRQTYTNVNGMSKNLIVQGEIVAGNDIDTGIFLNLPVFLAQASSLGEKVRLRELARPVYPYVSKYVREALCKVSAQSTAKWRRSSC